MVVMLPVIKETRKVRAGCFHCSQNSLDESESWKPLKITNSAVSQEKSSFALWEEMIPLEEWHPCGVKAGI